ncbi:hypothetical protein LJC59_05335 [Desulfovibrio sp. OttesenSCG-928-A18]|nr:hypothetical protein [Desulfovibrio sp. OttesenSCG-928-A18]
MTTPWYLSPPPRPKEEGAAPPHGAAAPRAAEGAPLTGEDSPPLGAKAADAALSAAPELSIQATPPAQGPSFSGQRPPPVFPSAYPGHHEDEPVMLTEKVSVLPDAQGEDQAGAGTGAAVTVPSLSPDAPAAGSAPASEAADGSDRAGDAFEDAGALPRVEAKPVMPDSGPSLAVAAPAKPAESIIGQAEEGFRPEEEAPAAAQIRPAEARPKAEQASDPKPEAGQDFLPKPEAEQASLPEPGAELPPESAAAPSDTGLLAESADPLPDTGLSPNAEETPPLEGLDSKTQHKEQEQSAPEAGPDAPEDSGDIEPVSFFAAAHAEQAAEESSFWADIPALPDNVELQELRALLFKREIAILEKLQARFNDPQVIARKVSAIIAEALSLRSGIDRGVDKALEPVVDNIVQLSLRKRQTEFVNALSPLMGPSIRKSIAESFRSMLESFSKSVEMAFSWKGLRWRFEAMRSGKPFSDIVLLHTLVYRVEQIFFIHSETGLVLAHLENEGAGSQDADMVSAMLTAIQDFVRDCFAGGAQGDLESLQMGDFKIFIEKTPTAYLACVVRGTPPSGFAEQLRGTLELMLIEYAEELAAFNGDTAPFASAVRHLDACMLSRYAQDSTKISLWAKAMPALALLALLWSCGYMYYGHTQEQKRQAALQEQRQAEQTAFLDKMRMAVKQLRAEPGLMLINVQERPSPPWDITALKDELARSPWDILREHGHDPLLFTFKLVPFISYDPSIILRRAQASIKLPENVRMTLDEAGTLRFTGTAPMAWIAETRDQARALPGVKHVDMQKLHDPKMEEIMRLMDIVEGTVIEFPLGKDTPVPQDMEKLTRAVDTLVELERLAKPMGFNLSLTIYGHADSTGLDKRNYEISQARTRTVAAMLYSRGSSLPISMYGMGSQYPKGGEGAREPSASAQGDQANRRIELRVHLFRAPAADVDNIIQ